ncbi:acyl carrier protein [Pendulispora rubella]|uniref:Acyl carrier protein n=1 Tax=Pendulispora rubella TaxID=2741070 RepID=A0ABZ2L6P8_9BACT
MSENTESDNIELHDRILAFVRDELANATERGELTATTPLLEAGILDSLRTARLIAWLRDDLGVRIPPLAMTGKNFHNIDRITDLVASLRTTALTRAIELGKEPAR